MATLSQVLAMIRASESTKAAQRYGVNPYTLTPQQNYNYAAKGAKHSEASGAYQFQPATWQSWTKASGIGTQYREAYQAPANVQDAVAAYAAINGPGVNSSGLWQASARARGANYPAIDTVDVDPAKLAVDGAASLAPGPTAAAGQQPPIGAASGYVPGEPPRGSTPAQKAAATEAGAQYSADQIQQLAKAFETGGEPARAALAAQFDAAQPAQPAPTPAAAASGYPGLVNPQGSTRFIRGNPENEVETPATSPSAFGSDWSQPRPPVAPGKPIPEGLPSGANAANWGGLGTRRAVTSGYGKAGVSPGGTLGRDTSKVRYNNHPTDVTQWQQFLKDQGLYQGAVDGKFGLETDHATRAFQALMGGQVDGIVGRQTKVMQQAYNNAVKTQSSVSATAQPQGPLSEAKPKAAPSEAPWGGAPASPIYSMLSPPPDRSKTPTKPAVPAETPTKLPPEPPAYGITAPDVTAISRDPWSKGAMQPVQPASHVLSVTGGMDARIGAPPMEAVPTYNKQNFQFQPPGGLAETLLGHNPYKYQNGTITGDIGAGQGIGVTGYDPNAGVHPSKDTAIGDDRPSIGRIGASLSSIPPWTPPPPDLSKVAPGASVALNPKLQNAVEGDSLTSKPGGAGGGPLPSDLAALLAAIPQQSGNVTRSISPNAPTAGADAAAKALSDRAAAADSASKSGALTVSEGSRSTPTENSTGAASLGSQSGFTPMSHWGEPSPTANDQQSAASAGAGVGGAGASGGSGMSPQVLGQILASLPSYTAPALDNAGTDSLGFHVGGT